MAWNVHVVIDTHSAAELASGVTTLKTFATGFPGVTPTVHDTCRTGEQTAYLKQWCTDNGAVYSRHMGAFKKMELVYEEILRRSTQPTVVASGDLVFYEDMRGTSVPRLFKGQLVPGGAGKKSIAFPNHTVVKESAYTVSLLFLKDPTAVQQQIIKINNEWEEQTIWQASYVVKDGVIYEQPRGFTYEMWKNTSDAFTTTDLNKYELVKGGGKYTTIQKELTDRGETTLASTHMTYVNAAIAEDWPSVKGARSAMYG
tara:strand:- start:1942 stop:2712 length:771 start_codon:yes stop_codon:yes gene_type:complete